MSLPRLYPKKARSARLLGCKRPRNGLQSLPPFWEPYFWQMTFLRTFAESGSAFICHCPGSIPKRHNVGASPFNPPQFSKKKITAWFYGLPLLFRKKSRLRSRKNNYRSARLFLLRLTTSSCQTPRLRFPAKGGKALMRRCRSSSAQRHGCTNCKKRSLCSVFCKTFAYHLCAVKRLTAFFCFGGTTAFFRQSVPLFVRNAVARSFCLRKCEACKKL